MAAAREHEARRGPRPSTTALLCRERLPEGQRMSARHTTPRSAVGGLVPASSEHIKLDLRMLLLQRRTQGVELASAADRKDGEGLRSSQTELAGALVERKGGDGLFAAGCVTQPGTFPRLASDGSQHDVQQCPGGNPSAGQTAGRTASEWAGNPGLDPRRKVSKQRARGSATYVVEKRLAEKQPLQLRRQKTPQRRRIPFQAWRALVDVAMAENFFTAPPVPTSSPTRPLPVPNASDMRRPGLPAVVVRVRPGRASQTMAFTQQVSPLRGHDSSLPSIRTVRHDKARDATMAAQKRNQSSGDEIAVARHAPPLLLGPRGGSKDPKSLSSSTTARHPRCKQQAEVAAAASSIRQSTVHIVDGPCYAEPALTVRLACDRPAAFSGLSPGSAHPAAGAPNEAPTVLPSAALSLPSQESGKWRCAPALLHDSC
ncbi:hypothetical protein PCL_01453 [Purpureocillium lilacinum]|uniref:Uncharacterized protein n=1 Tax=Purpureocillium lilacinum TaxID=33203 RepID=A0A2U3E3I6_PURLI|nr:hypothetical protein PCL_01453 [Purpureocillium lilacinum]